MKIVFTKGAGKYDVLQVLREGLPPERIDCPKQRIIPHDMVHYAVEHTLQQRGFLGRVRDGEAADFRMQTDAVSDSVERLVEVFQGDAWSGGGTAPAEMIAMYRVTCQARHCAPLALDESDILAVRAAMAELSLRWQAVPVGGSLELPL